MHGCDAMKILSRGAQTSYSEAELDEAYQDDELDDERLDLAGLKKNSV